jgi:hypothetical protein
MWVVVFLQWLVSDGVVSIWDTLNLLDYYSGTCCL